MRSLTESSQERFGEEETDRSLYRMMTRNITQTDFFLSSLLHYLEVTAAIKRANTVNALVEEVLKRNKAQLEEKRVRFFKRLEEDLPEITVPDEPLKFILNSVLQYALLSTPPGGNVEFWTTSSVFRREGSRVQPLFERYGGYVEISVVFPGKRKAAGPSEAAWVQIPVPQKGEMLDFMLLLVKRIVLKYWGKMDFETDERKGKALISLKFPLERRKMFFFEPDRTRPSASLPQS